SLSACREPLIISEDEEKQQLLMGNWILSDAVPPTASTIFLYFRDDLTVDIVVQADTTSSYTYFFRVEDGDLFFRRTDPEGPAEFIYNIDFISRQTLILSFSNGVGELLVQTYSKNE
ncbi:MAG: hypothetical protein KDC45_05005, partial [Bacteroidetes bacterium]|nr:hypothetical protein [Bacteroidota bacterium]